MSFESYIISEQNNLSEIQTYINEGANLCNCYFESGGYSMEDYFIAKRLHKEKETVESSMLRPISKGKLLSNFLNFHKKLRQSKTWSELDVNLSDEQQKKLHNLKERWDSQSSYSHFTVAALFAVTEVFNSLHSVLIIALQESYKRTYRKKEYIEDYKKYLIELIERLKEEKENIAETLYYRIKIAYANPFQSCNSLYDLLCQFQEIGVSTPYACLLTNEFVCTSTQEFPLAKAYSYILANGRPDLKAIVSSFFRLETKAKQPQNLQLFEHNSLAFLVPESFVPYIPTIPRFLVDLLPGFKMRYQFFHDKTELLFKLSALSKNKLPSLTLWEMQNTYWNNLENLQDALAQEKTTAFTKRKSGWGWFRKLSNAFIDKWENFIQDQQQRVLLHQINYLLAIAHMPLPLDYALDESQQAFEEKQAIRIALEKVEATIDQINFCEEKQRFMEVKNKIMKRWGIQAKSKLAIDSIVINLSNAIQVPTAKFANFLLTIRLKNIDELTILANDYHEEFKKMIISIDHFINELTEQLNSNLLLVNQNESFQLNKQLISTLSFFAKTGYLSHFADQTRHQKLLNFIYSYQNFLKTQTPEFINAHEKSLIELEKLLSDILAVNPDWDILLKELVRVEEYRYCCSKGETAIDDDAFLESLQKTSQEAQKCIEDSEQFLRARNAKRLASEQVFTEQLGRLGLYKKQAYDKDIDQDELEDINPFIFNETIRPLR